MVRKFLYRGSLALALQLLAGAVMASTPAGLYSDEELARSVERELRDLNLSGLEVSVISGVVTLRGQAPSLDGERNAAERAERARGVKAVDDEMSVEASAGDAEIARAVRQKLEGSSEYTIYDYVETAVDSGRVLLTGRVTSLAKVAKLEKLVAEVVGVRAIKNEIRVLPESPTDEKIRIAIAIEIYRRLPELDTRPSSPIHVIVENGRVTLEGEVRDETESKTAELEARRIPGASSVRNELKVEAASFSA